MRCAMCSVQWCHYAVTGGLFDSIDTNFCAVSIESQPVLLEHSEQLLVAVNCVVVG